jgi:hypothetical protein
MAPVTIQEKEWVQTQRPVKYFKIIYCLKQLNEKAASNTAFVRAAVKIRYVFTLESAF